MARSRRSRQQATDTQERQDLVWRKMDLHIHTPASADYQERGVSPIDILQRAEACGIDILAFTDHNSVRGYAQMWREIEDLELLEALGRMEPAEERLLAEYRRLLNRILLLPGFEFTATFGFHILAIFPEDTSIRKLEHILLTLNIAEDKVDLGTSEVGATTDVLNAYEILDEAGALVIGAHVNSTHGVAMQGFPFGGQTKIAYTQNEHLHALEATDLDNPGSRSTARFFSGAKAEYPRRMHIIQGSDAHRLVRDPSREKDLGVGDRMTEVLLPEVSFAALKALLESTEFSRTRAYRGLESQFELVLEARAEGNTTTQAFHERLGKSRRKTNTIFKDITAIANTEGGTVYVGLDANPSNEVVGVPRAKVAADQLREDIDRFITPTPAASIEIQSTGEREILIVTITNGPDKPYALVSGEIYVREDGNTVVANRDQIVQLVRSAIDAQSPNGHRVEEKVSTPSEEATETESPSSPEKESEELNFPIPRTGVEVVSTDTRNGTAYHTMRDLRNLNVVENVTRDSARRLWRYAIQQEEGGAIDPEKVQWDGPYGFVRAQKQRDGAVRFDLAYRENGRIRVFYGVTAKGIRGPWKSVIPDMAPERSS